MKKSYITATDQFCGAGGSSIGATAAGVEVRLAMNHWKLAIETHNTNFPRVDHVCTDISATDPRRYPSTDILITSPECTNHTIAKGKPRRLYAKDLFGNILIDPAEERSRATMWDVPRFAEYHDYEIIVVENVVDAAKWRLFSAWLQAMHTLEYSYKIVYFNSMFAHPTPQSRDRMYTIFWKKNNPAPDLDFRPLAPCPRCGVQVDAVQSWKHGRWGRYKRQYIYTCPVCRVEVIPYYYAVANAIDWSIQSERIADRKKPLKQKTLERIKYGLEIYGKQSFLVETNYTQSGSARISPITRYANAQTARQSAGIVIPPQPYLVRTVRQQSPRNGISSVLSPANTQTTCQDVGLVSYGSFLTYYYGTESASGLNEPAHTMTGIDRAGLVRGLVQSLNLDDLTFRMLQPHEIGRIMAFGDDYQVLGNHREKVKQYGNAVTPPVMEQIVRRCVNSLQR